MFTNIKFKEDDATFIGCCGVYCKTCKPYKDGFCKGCRLGYANGGRNISKAKCVIKLCCIVDKKLNTCAECVEITVCKKISGRFKLLSYEYKKCIECLNFINKNGEDKFMEIANNWTGPRGKLRVNN